MRRMRRRRRHHGYHPVEERVENANLILTEIDASIERLAQEKETALKYQKLKTEKLHDLCVVLH